MIVDLESFETVMRELWPSAKFTEGYLAMVFRKFRDVSKLDLEAAIRKERSYDLDATRPSFTRISATLKVGPKERSALFDLLAFMRRQDPGLQDKPDHEVYARFMDANLYPITHSTVTGKAKTDFSRVKRLCDREREAWRGRFTEDLIQKEMVVPCYLEKSI
jgi:hypothetical protein